MKCNLCMLHLLTSQNSWTKQMPQQEMQKALKESGKSQGQHQNLKGFEANPESALLHLDRYVIQEMFSDLSNYSHLSLTQKDTLHHHHHILQTSAFSHIKHKTHGSGGNNKCQDTDTDRNVTIPRVT